MRGQRVVHGWWRKPQRLRPNQVYGAAANRRLTFRLNHHARFRAASLRKPNMAAVDGLNRRVRCRIQLPRRSDAALTGRKRKRVVKWWILLLQLLAEPLTVEPALVV